MKFSCAATIILSETRFDEIFREAIHMKDLLKIFGQALLGGRMKEFNRLKAMRDEFRGYSDQKLIDICRYNDGVKRRVAVFVLQERRRV